MARTSVRIKPNPVGIGQLLRSQEVGADMERRAAQIAAAAGSADDFYYGSTVTGDRVRAFAGTKSENGRRLQATDHVLIRALDAGRS